MALYVDMTVDGASTVFADLYAICGCDGGIGQASVPNDPGLAQITYHQRTSSATADRINALANRPFTDPVVISGMSTQEAAQLGVDGGITTLDSKFNPPIVRVVYDTTQCYGNGYWAVDPFGGHIPLPNDVILYHELAHAYQYLTTGVSNDEIRARTDENDERRRDGLLLRDVNNPLIGCGLNYAASVAPCGQSSSSAGGECLIATAAYGSSRAQEIIFLRGLRDGTLRKTRWGIEFYEQFAAEYYRFSPRIAAEIREDDDLARNVLCFVVGPLLDIYRAAATLVQSGPTSTDFVEATIEALDRFRKQWSNDPSLPVAYSTVNDWCLPLITGRSLEVGVEGLTYAVREGSQSGRTVRLLSERILASCPGVGMDHFSWAVVDPLGIWWQGVALFGRTLDETDSSRLGEVQRWMSDCLFEWFRAAPRDGISPRDLDEVSEVLIGLAPHLSN